MERSDRERMIQQHLAEIRRLEAQQARQESGVEAQWPPRGYYWLYHIIVGMTLGFIGAAVSLLCNVAGSIMVGNHPLQLIRVYLTFPMGGEALEATGGEVLFVGCVLYLVTGGLYGIVFHFVMSWYFRGAALMKRFAVASVIGLGLWLINFYGVLSWLQPALLGDNWIITEIPPWVAALTHLAFAWTMALVETWGSFIPLSDTSGFHETSANGAQA